MHALLQAVSAEKLFVSIIVRLESSELIAVAGARPSSGPLVMLLPMIALHRANH